MQKLVQVEEVASFSKNILLTQIMRPVLPLDLALARLTVNR